jgi:hypothetical protein
MPAQIPNGSAGSPQAAGLAEAWHPTPRIAEMWLEIGENAWLSERRRKNLFLITILFGLCVFDNIEAGLLR